MELKKVNMDRILLSKNKIVFDEGEVFLLAKSIALTGLLSPISLISLAHSDRFEIVSGNKRFYACRLLGYKEIPSLIIKAESHFARALLKKGSWRDVFAEADAVKEAMVKTGLSAEEFANYTSYTQKEVLELLKLTSLTELEREMVRKNEVSIKGAIEISSFSDIKKRTWLISEAIKKRLKTNEIAALCDKEKKGKRYIERPFGEKKVKFKDLRLFDNTVNRAVGILKDAGVKTEMNTEKSENTTEYRIKIINEA